jgi:hypothetical protein
MEQGQAHVGLGFQSACIWKFSNSIAGLPQALQMISQTMDGQSANQIKSPPPILV